MNLPPTLIWILCFLIALVFWLILYFKDSTYKEIHPFWKISMYTLRGLVTAIMLYLVLAPLFKSILTEVKKPIIVFAQDNSKSLVNNWTAEKQQKYLQDKANLEKALSVSYDILPISFGEQVKENGQIDFSERATDISAALDYIQNQTAGQNLGAIVLATDGNFNQGNNPLYSHPSLIVPIYTVMLGDSTIKRDLAIQRVLNNSIVYLGDQFEVQVELKALQCINERTNLQVFRIEGGQERLLQNVILDIKLDDWFYTHRFILDAAQAGTAHFMVRTSSLKNEYALENNNKDFFVDILDARQKVMVLAASPHPDLAVIKKILEGNKNYLVDIALHNEFKGKWADYSMVIFHQLPSKTVDIASVIKEINTSQKPRIFILGSQTDLSKFNAAQSLLKVVGDSRNMNEVTAEVKESFSLFKPNPEWKEIFKTFPPLSAPFGEYQTSAGAQILMTQKIGNILTNFPLCLIGEDQGIRTGIFSAEGIWKWRYFNYLENKNFDVIDDMVQKVVQFIGLKEDKRKFRVIAQQKIYLENQRIRFDAQLFNDSYEPTNTDEVFIAILSPEKKEYQFTFSKTERAYTLDGGLFAPGTYTYTAYTNTKSGRQEVKGQFVVQRIQLETYQSTADHNLLRLLAAQHGGLALLPDQISSLENELIQQKAVKPIQYSSQRTYPIINFRWLFALLALMLCTEWFLRRYHGAY